MSFIYGVILASLPKMPASVRFGLRVVSVPMFGGTQLMCRIELSYNLGEEMLPYLWNATENQEGVRALLGKRKPQWDKYRFICS